MVPKIMLWLMTPENLKMDFESSIEVKGFFVSNSTYAYLEMRDGSDWTKYLAELTDQILIILN
jgi:hypothetical protein